MLRRLRVLVVISKTSGDFVETIQVHGLQEDRELAEKKKTVKKEKQIRTLIFITTKSAQVYF